ncbi:MAG: hypothetical protein WA944_13370 [Mycobacterium sp.]
MVRGNADALARGFVGVVETLAVVVAGAGVVATGSAVGSSSASAAGAAGPLGELSSGGFGASWSLEASAVSFPSFSWGSSSPSGSPDGTSASSVVVTGVAVSTSTASTSLSGVAGVPGSSVSVSSASATSDDGDCASEFDLELRESVFVRAVGFVGLELGESVFDPAVEFADVELAEDESSLGAESAAATGMLANAAIPRPSATVAAAACVVSMSDLIDSSGGSGDDCTDLATAPTSIRRA